jgi:ATP-binding cassette subfamily F protein uup
MRAERAQAIERTGRAALAVDTGAASGTLVIEAKNLSKSFRDRTIIGDFSTRIMRGDKVGLIGPNGAGKSTLLKMLMGQLVPDSGTLRLGTNITPVILDQSRASLDPEMTLWDTLCEGGGDQVMVRGQPRHVVSYLRDFLFRESQARQPVKALSGGEQGRLILARALAKPSNLLVLDEPTNDLDMETLDLLQEMLTDYEGTVLLVSHDRDFLDRVVSSVIALDGRGGAEEYPGGYTDWQRFVSIKNKSVSSERTETAPAQRNDRAPKAATKLSYKETRLLDELAAKMPKLQDEMAKLESQLADPGLYARDAEGFARITARLDVLRGELTSAEEQWLELEMKKEELSGS